MEEKRFYEHISKELAEKIEEDQKVGKKPFAFDDSRVLRRDDSHDRADVIRTPFIRDCDKIINCPMYNRYADKTQVFSFYKNDDLSRRALHVQLVSRISRTIGKALGLNTELIEAIALGHDIGHTPFGHSGERVLDSLYFNHAGRHFMHNIQSVRVLDAIYPYNISLQTLSGIASHNGEIEMEEYRPRELSSFDEFDELMEECCLDETKSNSLVPSTLEGCVVRISDIIAYIGKDRQDAERLKLLSEDFFEPSAIGSINAEFINNLVVNIIENSYGRDYIKMDRVHFDALKKAKADNYEYIYNGDAAGGRVIKIIEPMMADVYDALLSDLKQKNTSSDIYKDHIAYISKAHYARKRPYEDEPADRIVVDFIASMTDDYFVDLYRHIFPDRKVSIEYKEYF